MSGDDLGDRMKDYELRETGRRFLPMLPVYARIDGRCFSSFTRGMARPFDEQFHQCMVETTRQLVKETGALVGYTQSDEINLLWYRPDPKSQLYFDGKIFKILSVTAALTSGWFQRFAQMTWPEKVAASMPIFDCRAFQFPTLDEAANAILWRELDATKNAISMAARAHFSHKDLMNKNGAEMQDMLFQRANVNFSDYPDWCKRGTFVLRRTVMRELDAKMLAKIPEGRRPEGPIERKVIEQTPMPQFSKVTNRVGVLFHDEEPCCVQVASKRLTKTGRGERI